MGEGGREREEIYEHGIGRTSSGQNDEISHKHGTRSSGHCAKSTAHPSLMVNRTKPSFPKFWQSYEPSLSQLVLTITVPAVSKTKFEKQRLIDVRRAIVDAKAVSIIL